MNFLGEDEWLAFSEIIQAAEEAGVNILIGGALGLSAYMPLQRHTKDVDLYVLPEDRPRLVSVLNELGFDDLYEQMPYDRGWIYRGVRRGVIADVIWGFANKHALVDPYWFRFSREMMCSETALRIVPPEELIWAKLFVLQRDRCDWPDLLNLLYYAGPTLDWGRLRSRLGDDSPLLDGLISVFSWVCPGRLLEKKEDTPSQCTEIRASLLDSREWFLAAFTSPEDAGTRP